MSNTGNAIKQSIKLFNTLTADKPHSSVTDWVEILTGDNYAENELDGVSELVQATDIQREGPDEASRAIRKKLKYGSTHRQLRSLTLLKSLSENSSTFHKSFATSPMLLERLKETARDGHTDPRVRQKLMLVLKGWQQQALDGDAGFSRVKGMYAECGGGAPSRRGSVQVGSAAPSAPAKPAVRDDGLWDHTWSPSPAAAAAAAKESKSNAETARVEALLRKEQAMRDAEEKARRERDLRDLQRRERELEEKAERLRKLEASKSTGSSVVNNRKKPASKEPKRPPFNFEKEKPQVLACIAGGSQAANNLTNSIRHVNRESESIVTNLRVQRYLEEAKQSRRKIIRYIQVVEDEEFIGTLLQANETIISSLQLYDKASKPSEHDSDDEHPDEAKPTGGTPKSPEEDALSKAMAAQSLRETELAKLQAKQRAAVDRERQRRAEAERAKAHPDLQDLSFSNGGGAGSGRRGSLPSPIQPTHDTYSSNQNADLSDLSDYDSSDDDYQIRARSQPASRRGSRSAATAQEPAGGRYASQSSSSSAGGRGYGALGDDTDGDSVLLGSSLKDDDPFADPFFGEAPPTPAAKERKEWASV